MILMAFQNIYMDASKMDSTPLSGDDLTDIIVFVVLKAAAQNLVQTMYCVINHLSQQVLQGEVGYNTMGITIAISVICTMTQDYIRKPNTELANTDLLNKIYLIPHANLYTDLIC